MIFLYAFMILVPLGDKIAHTYIHPLRHAHTRTHVHRWNRERSIKVYAFGCCWLFFPSFLIFMCDFFVRRSANELEVAKQGDKERKKAAMRGANEKKRANARANHFASVFICSKSYHFTLCFAINNKSARIHTHAAQQQKQQLVAVRADLLWRHA